MPMGIPNPTQSLSDWVYITQTRVIQWAAWFILGNNRNLTQHNNMPYRDCLWN